MANKTLICWNQPFGFGPVSAGDVLVDGSGNPFVIDASNLPGGGTVTSVSVATANGVSGSVATPTTTPVITLTLGAITPSSVNGNTLTTGTGTLTLSSFTLTVTGTASVSGTNTGDQNLSALAPLASPALTGTPTAPTATVGTNTTQIATTAFVLANAGGGGTVAVTGGGTGLTTLTAHAVMLGEGTGNVGFAATGTAGNVLIDQGASADPAFTTISGVITLTSGGVTALVNSAVTYAKIQNVTKSRLLGNPSISGAAAPSEITLGASLAFSGSSLICTIMTASTFAVFGNSPSTQLGAFGYTVGFTANTTTNVVCNESTFVGPLGSSAYTICDVITALKAYGLLAM